MTPQDPFTPVIEEDEPDYYIIKEHESELYDVAEDDDPMQWEFALGCTALILLSGAVTGGILLIIVHLIRRFM